LGEPFENRRLADHVEAAMDEAGWETAHIAGNSLGAYVALQLAGRDRARTVVALAPAGGWAPGSDAWREVLGHFERSQQALKRLAPHAGAIASGADGRRRATSAITVAYEHLSEDLIAHLMIGAARCDGLETLHASAAANGWPLDLSAVTCPVRMVWGLSDRLLPFPSAASRYLRGLPQADWVELDGVGHCPQLDVPLETAQLILGFTQP
jgi:pimeloyl-ACP methyl ester carboxylesterase